MDLKSIAEQVFEDLSISDYTSDPDSLQPVKSTSRTHKSPAINGSSSSRSLANKPAAASNRKNEAVRVQFNITSAEDEPLFELYKQILDWLDPYSTLFTCSQPKTGTTRLISQSDKYSGHSGIPSLAVVWFLHEQSGHLQQVQQFLETRPWKLHHQEVLKSKTDCYYMLTTDRPLCAVKQILCGKEQIQLRRNVSHKHWADTLSLYKLIVGKECVFLKQDLCVFTVASHQDYDIQFALKKLSKGIVPKKTRKADLSFQVKDIGSLVPLFPRECIKLSKFCWCTKDLDGHRVYMHLPIKLSRRCRSASPSKLYSHSTHSAFSPVQPHRHQNLKVLASDSLLDKLSPRVYQNPVPNATGRPPLPRKPTNSEHKAPTVKINHCKPHSIRVRPSSAGSVPIATKIVEEKRQYSTLREHNRPLSAGSVPIATPNCADYSHQYTDSGFVDSSLDSSHYKDFRRTPIIGTPFSHITQYQNHQHVSRSSGEVPLTPNSDLSKSSYDNDVFPVDLQPQSTQRKLHSNIHTSHSTHMNNISNYFNYSTNDWVESYVQDQNKLLGFREMSYQSNCINGDVLQLENTQTMREPCQVTYANISSNCDTSCDRYPPSFNEKVEEKFTSTDAAPQVQMDSKVPEINQYKIQQVQEPSPTVPDQVSATSQEEHSEVLSDDDLTPRSAAIDPNDHDLEEYMHLCWASASPLSPKIERIVNSSLSVKNCLEESQNCNQMNSSALENDGQTTNVSSLNSPNQSTSQQGQTVNEAGFHNVASNSSEQRRSQHTAIPCNENSFHFLQTPERKPTMEKPNELREILEEEKRSFKELRNIFSKKLNSCTEIKDHKPEPMLSHHSDQKQIFGFQSYQKPVVSCQSDQKPVVSFQSDQKPVVSCQSDQKSIASCQNKQNPAVSCQIDQKSMVSYHSDQKSGVMYHNDQNPVVVCYSDQKPKSSCQSDQKPIVSCHSDYKSGAMSQSDQKPGVIFRNGQKQSNFEEHSVDCGTKPIDIKPKQNSFAEALRSLLQQQDKPTADQGINSKNKPVHLVESPWNGVNLPDVVQTNDIGVPLSNTKVKERIQEFECIEEREGSPHTELSLHNVHKSKRKTVRFCDNVETHTYEALDWNDDITEQYNMEDYYTTNEQIDTTHELSYLDEMCDDNNIYVSLDNVQSLSSGKVASIVAKFNSIKTSEEPKESTGNSAVLSSISEGVEESIDDNNVSNSSQISTDLASESNGDLQQFGEDVIHGDVPNSNNSNEQELPRISMDTHSDMTSYTPQEWDKLKREECEAGFYI